ncbi:MAG: C-terminal helicase domain-containing protein, partial [Solirubrobacterales bacterium]
QYAYDELSKRSSNLIEFRIVEDAPAAMTTLSLICPYPALAEIGDPLALSAALRSGGDPPSLDEIRSLAEVRVAAALESVREQLERAPDEGAMDQDWYWAAPLLLDLDRAPVDTRSWWQSANANAWIASDDEAGDEVHHEEASLRLERHLARARDFVSDPERSAATLGRVPDDLVQVLTSICLGSPAVCALRSLQRVTSGESECKAEVSDASARIAWGFRSMFNGGIETAIVRPLTSSAAYWAAVLEYCQIGNVQAMLDEYLHVLTSWLGLVDTGGAKAAEALGRSAYGALSTKSVNYAIDELAVRDGAVVIHRPATMRAKFAVSFGQQRSEDAGAMARIKNLSQAFNSPFWPFVLTSTSVGQEGLDFHLYSHAVVHWNVPNNPVDFEQREGRVHRFKGHAVRKNVASGCAEAAFSTAGGDPWEHMFHEAVSIADDPDEVKPYWVFEHGESSACIERYVPHLPFTNDASKLDRLLKAVVAYRLAFGQPRQEELVEYLADSLNSEELQRLAARLRIDLAPADLW